MARITSEVQCKVVANVKQCPGNACKMCMVSSKGRLVGACTVPCQDQAAAAFPPPTPTEHKYLPQVSGWSGQLPMAALEIPTCHLQMLLH